MAVRCFLEDCVRPFEVHAVRRVPSVPCCRRVAHLRTTDAHMRHGRARDSLSLRCPVHDVTRTSAEHGSTPRRATAIRTSCALLRVEVRRRSARSTHIGDRLPQAVRMGESTPQRRARESITNRIDSLDRHARPRIS
jgi:hypothetical protein